MAKKHKFRGPIQFYMIIPFISVFILLVVDIILAFDRPKTAIFGFVLTAIYAAIMIIAYRFFKVLVVKEMVSFSKELGKSQTIFLDGLSIPHLEIHKDQILWANDTMMELFPDKIKQGYNLSEKFPKLYEAVNSMIKTHKTSCGIKIGESFYRVEMTESGIKHRVNPLVKKLSQDVSTYYGLYFYDETQLIKFKHECSDKRIVTGLVYIDNYDEIIETIDDVDQSYATALLDRVIGEYVRKYDGICKKTENDKYFIVFNNLALAKMEEDKFSVATSIRELDQSLDVKPTISVGIGCGADSYGECYSNARLAMEMALSRGGDQVVVKETNKEARYYGGKSERDTKNNRVKARFKAETFRDLIINSDSIFVMGHKLSDVDSIGAAVGVSCIAQAFGKKVKIVLNEETVSVRPIIDRLKTDSSYDDNIFISSSDAMTLANSKSLIIVVDTNRPSMVECEELLGISSKIAVIDHHRVADDSIKNTIFSFIDTYASSASEMVTEIIRYIDDNIKPSPSEADSMYSGIMIDTNNFLTKTGVRTFEAAAFLRRCGTDVSRVRKIFRDDVHSYQAKAETVQNAEIYRDHFVIGIFPKVNIDSPMIIGAQAANELLNIDGIKASFVLTEYKGTIYLSARSIDEVNVQIIAEKLGGGGHISVAGAQFKDKTIESVREMLMTVIDKIVEEGDL